MEEIKTAREQHAILVIERSLALNQLGDTDLGLLKVVQMQKRAILSENPEPLSHEEAEECGQAVIDIFAIRRIQGLRLQLKEIAGITIFST